MDRDNFVPQSTGGHVREGHEESDLSIRGIVISAVVLAVCGFLSFALMKGFLVVLPSIQARIWPQPQLTPVQQQLEKERAAPPAKFEGGVEGRPEWYASESSNVARGEMEAHLDRTFPTPRLQYDDGREMQSFQASEEERLESTFKDTEGNVHIPIKQAMDLITKNGLPPVSGPFVPPTLPAAVPLVPATTATGTRK